MPGGRGRVAPWGHGPGHVPGPGAGPAQRQPGPRGPLQLPPPCHRRDPGRHLPAAGLPALATGHRVLGQQLPAGRELLLGAEPRPSAGHRLRGHLQARLGGG